jgi:hypothetical protein
MPRSAHSTRASGLVGQNPVGSPGRFSGGRPEAQFEFLLLPSISTPPIGAAISIFFSFSTGVGVSELFRRSRPPMQDVPPSRSRQTLSHLIQSKSLSLLQTRGEQWEILPVRFKSFVRNSVGAVASGEVGAGNFGHRFIERLGIIPENEPASASDLRSFTAENGTGSKKPDGRRFGRNRSR